MSGELVKYEAARYALQVAKGVDEVKNIRDKAQALAAYARQAKDDDMITWATEIKLRAERRVGELLNATERNLGAAAPKTNAVTSGDRVAPTLDEIGLTKRQSADFQSIATIPDKQFEEAVATGKATTKSLVRKSKKGKAASAKTKSAAIKSPNPAARQQEDSGPALTPKEVERLALENEALRNDLTETKDALAELTGIASAADAVKNGEEFKKIVALEAELKSVKRRRDELMNENAELKRMLSLWRNRAEKAERKKAA